MNKIAFLVPHAPNISFIAETVSRYPQVHVKYCPDYNQVVAFAEDLIIQGYQIIIARAGTASRLNRAHLHATIVELPVTGFDIIRALAAASSLGNKIAVVGYTAMMKDLDCLKSVLSFPFMQYLTDRDDMEIEALIHAAIQDGTDVIVGGGTFCQAAKQQGLPAVFIENGRESVLQAVEEALRIQTAIEAEKLKRSLFAAVLDYVHDGIITVDRSQTITSINLRAQKFFSTSSQEAIGQKIGKFWPSISLFEVLRTGQEEISKLMQIKSMKVLCNKVPIIVNDKPSGALITFQDITKIQQTEAKIRKEIYNKGHVAKKHFTDVWGTSAGITQVVALAKEFAGTNANVLIAGESGTGKEVFSQSIHNHSLRSTGPFVAVNCAALPAQILESELFGYVGGAFTGANKEGKPGLFELAHGGTIFLDEIAEMDYVNQSRLLRVLQERAVMRLGSDRVISIDVRVIAATNKDLKELLRTHKFREDLFFRLNVLKLELPPLRERPQDIRVLIQNFIDKLAPSGRTLKLEAQALRILENYRWPGNIRELQNTAERLIAFCQTGTVRASDVESVLEQWDSPPKNVSFHDEEIREITAALRQAKGIQTTAAKILGIDRTTLWRKMKKLGIPASRL